MTTKIAIIGAGNVGGALASQFSKFFPIKFGVRHAVKPEILDKCNKANTSSGSVSEACKWADLIILAVPAEAVIGTAEGLKNELAHKVVIDATNPLRFDSSGVSWTPPPEGSTTAALQKICPTAKFVKAYNTFGYEFMSDPMKNGTQTDVMIAGDDAAAKKLVAEISNTAGFNAVDAGGLRNAAALENVCILWVHMAVFGGRGRNFTFKLVDEKTKQ